MDVSALAPFRNSENSYWPSSATTSTLALHYPYPEFNGLVDASPTATRDAILQYVEGQYGRGRFTGLGGGFKEIRLAQPAAGCGAQAPVAAAPFHSRGGPPHSAPKPEHGKEGPTVINDWTCRIHCKKYELGGSYWVLIFLGEVPEDPSNWHTCSSFVGGHYCFVNSVADKCSNCRSQADLVTEGFVHLNPAIASRSGLSSYDPSVITPYLKENLHWRVQKVRV
jgi:tyrosinase